MLVSKEEDLAKTATIKAHLPRFQDRGYMAALAILKDEAAAEDALQEANAKTLKASSRYNETAPFYPWFYRILKNHCLDLLAQRKRRPQVRDPQAVIDQMPVSASSESRLIRSQRDAALHKAIASLSDTHREILHLRHWQDLSYEGISEVLGCPVGTVMSRLYRARRALQDILNADPDWSL